MCMCPSRFRHHTTCTQTCLSLPSCHLYGSKHRHWSMLLGVPQDLFFWVPLNLQWGGPTHSSTSPLWHCYYPVDDRGTSTGIFLIRHALSSEKCEVFHIFWQLKSSIIIKPSHDKKFCILISFNYFYSARSKNQVHYWFKTSAIYDNVV